MNNTIFATILIVSAILFRTAWHIRPNIEFITTASIVAAVYLGKRWSIVVPFLSVILSDIVIGNTSIFLFTWSAYLLIGSGVNLMNRLSQSAGFSRVVNSIGGMGAGIFFFLWTNFGVWLLDNWDMYPDTFSGLVQSYVRGLPFLRYTLLGNILFTSISIGSIELMKLVSFRFFQQFRFVPVMSKTK